MPWRIIAPAEGFFFRRLRVRRLVQKNAPLLWGIFTHRIASKNAIASIKRRAYARKKLSSQQLYKTSDICRDFTVLGKQSDFNSSQILHYGRFFRVYACHDSLITAFFGLILTSLPQSERISLRKLIPSALWLL
jgi:hypothetical protein